MEYKKITVKITPYSETVSDIMIAQFGEFGFESFEETSDGFNGYIPSDKFDKTDIENVSTFVDDTKFTWSEEIIPDQNWNKVWEENFFKPIIIDNSCLIRSPFHTKDVETKYEIIINPQMSFGTGHHATTCSMIRFILETNIVDKTVLDMGYGTGILGIMASKCGAKKVVGIDIDEWCYNNSLENIELNDIKNMSVEVGEATSLAGRESYDIILANINRNILLADMDKYVDVLNCGGTLIMSGFYECDTNLIIEHATKLGLTEESMKVENEWTAIKFTKK